MGYQWKGNRWVSDEEVAADHDFWMKVIAFFIPVIGLTATGRAIGGEGLGIILGIIGAILGVVLNELIVMAMLFAIVGIAGIAAIVIVIALIIGIAKH
jgi:hypothetical protein